MFLLPALDPSRSEVFDFSCFGVSKRFSLCYKKNHKNLFTLTYIFWRWATTTLDMHKIIPCSVSFHNTVWHFQFFCGHSYIQDKWRCLWLHCRKLGALQTSTSQLPQYRNASISRKIKIYSRRFQQHFKIISEQTWYIVLWLPACQSTWADTESFCSILTKKIEWFCFSLQLIIFHKPQISYSFKKHRKYYSVVVFK